MINDEEKSPCHGKKQQIRCHGLFSFRSSHFYAPLGFRFFPTERFAQLLPMLEVQRLSRKNGQRGDREFHNFYGAGKNGWKECKIMILKCYNGIELFYVTIMAFLVKIISLDMTS